MQIAERMSTIEPSMTLAINARAQEMRAEGIPVISVAAGEPDFPTPQFIKDAAIKAIEDNFTRYTQVAGIPELRKAAADYFGRQYRTEVSPESLIMGAGGKQCLYTFMQTFLNPGDEILIPSPYWVSYPDMVRLAGGTPVFVPTSAASSFKATPAMLEEKTTEKTRLLILNSPCNPTGAVYTDREFTAIMRWALGRALFVLSDEIYDQLVYPPATMTSAITWFASCPELVAVVNGLSKSYAMTGWRVGFLAGAPELIRKMSLLQGHSLSNIVSFVQKAAVAALNGPNAEIADMRKAFEHRRDMCMQVISTWPNVICPRPEGAFYIFMDVSAYYRGNITNSIEMCRHILEKGHVAAVPGIAFGDDRCIRISYATGDKELEKALEQMGNALALLR